jgi:beta-1,4-mannosyltransferase
MRVLFLPDYRATNPYQTQLANNLMPQGVELKWGLAFGFGNLLQAARQPDRPDLVHLHWTTPFWFDDRPGIRQVIGLRFLLALHLIKRAGIKLVWTVHNLHTHENPRPAFEYWLNHFICRLADAVIVHCQAARSLVGHHYHLSPDLYRKVKVIEHGHFIGTYNNEVTTAQARQALGFNQDEFIFLYFGQIRAYKGVPQLITSFRGLKRPSARLLIAGQPISIHLSEQIQAACQAEQNISFFSHFIPDGQIQLYMKAADIVVLPFQAILTSSTVILAMSFGRPLLLPDTGCLRETTGHNGAIFYQPDDPNGLWQALAQAYEADLLQMGQDNLARARQFDWQQIGRQTYLLYQSCWPS